MGPDRQKEWMKRKGKGGSGTVIGTASDLTQGEEGSILDPEE